MTDVTGVPNAWLQHGGTTAVREHVRAISLSLGLVAAATACLLVVTGSVDMQHVSSAYLVPVLIAATRLGVIPALVAAIGGVATSAFLFYPPVYDFYIASSRQLLDLALFVVVAAVTGQLATRARKHALVAEARENDMRSLYEFSKRLAVATDAAQIHCAIQDHLALITGCRIKYFASEPRVLPLRDNDGLALAGRRAAEDMSQGDSNRFGVWTRDPDSGDKWLVRAISPEKPAFGYVAIDARDVTDNDVAIVCKRIDATLIDAAATLTRLDIAGALAEATNRANAETLRAALMSSVSHELRTPLASIIGSASILVEAPDILKEPRLAALTSIVRDEADRLNGDIQRLLDAANISSAGIRPHISWAEVSDIVNSAVRAQGKHLAARQVEVALANDLPLVHVDPVLIEQALRQIIDNAVKYSPVNSTIRVETCERNGSVEISVRDQGIGLMTMEMEHIFERFYRGTRSREVTSGSGLGLWIADALVSACGARLAAASQGVGCGAAFRIVLPKPGGTVCSDGEHDD